MSSPAEQIAVRASALEADMASVFRKRVNEKPVRLNMTVAASDEIPSQRMILEARRQRFAFDEQINDCLELGHVHAAPDGEFHLFFELARAAESPHRPRSS